MAVVNYLERPDTPKPTIFALTIWSRGFSADDRSGRNGCGGQFPSTNGRDANASTSLICRKPLLFHAILQTKAFVAPGRDLVAFLLVRGDAADIRHEYAGFPRNVGADVP